MFFEIYLRFIFDNIIATSGTDTLFVSWELFLTILRPESYFYRYKLARTWVSFRLVWFRIIHEHNYTVVGILYLLGMNPKKVRTDSIIEKI